MKNALLFIFLLACTLSEAQNPEGFDEMVDGYVKGTVTLAKPTQLKFEMSKNSDIVVLDSREKSEYDVSHIKGARFVGYKDFDIESLSDISKDTKVYVYCSIGYRSEKIGEKLQKVGFTKVYNLYGGIFNWANAGYPIENEKGKLTKEVHGYNRKWSKWINGDLCKKTLK
jgi:rhodanese-related sulfurtransferase